MIEINQNYSLKEFNSFGFKYRAEYFCEVNSIEECHEFIDFCLKKKIPIKFLGEGTNVVLSRNIKGGVLKISLPGRAVKEDVVDFGAGENWNEVVLWSLENQLFGLENLALIPGTAGAAPIQNIGAYGEEISSKLISLEAINIKTNELISISNKECEFSYRDSVFKAETNKFLVSSIKLKLSKETKTNITYNSLKDYLIRDDIDPEYATPYQVCRAVTSIRSKILPDYRNEPNVGSFFKNVVLNKKNLDKLKSKIVNLPYYENIDGLTYKVPVAFLIENLGWKGKKLGNVRVSEKHALVLIADEGASSVDLMSLSSEIADDIYKNTHIKIEIEPEVF